MNDACTHCWHEGRRSAFGRGRIEWEEWCCWCHASRKMEQDQGPMPGHGDYALWVAVGEPRPYVEREWVPLGGNLVEERPKCICGPSNTPLVNCPVHGATCTACGEVWDDAHRKDWRCPKEQVKA